MSPQLAQNIAEAAFQDASAKAEGKSSLEDLEKISTIGCSGVYKNKCYGDLMACIPFKVNIATPAWCKLPFKSPHNMLTQQVLLPHELFANIYRWYPATWKKCIMPGQDRLAEFWRVNSMHPCMKDSPLKSRDQYQRFCIPISIHGDDVPITGVGKAWAQQMTIFSWCSMIGYGSVKDLSYFIFGCFDKLRAVCEDQTKDTLGVFFKILVWSLKWLYLGQWPDRDWNNKKYLWCFPVVLEITLFMSILTTPSKVPHKSIFLHRE